MKRKPTIGPEISLFSLPPAGSVLVSLNLVRDTNQQRRASCISPAFLLSLNLTRDTNQQRRASCISRAFYYL